MLEIRNLHARIAEDGTEIIRGLNLTVQAGEVAAIMGPNGSGKSTLSYVLAGRDDYEVTEGDILYNGHSILEMDPAERAAAGIFLAFQYPMEIPGVATMEFLKVAMNAQRKARDEEPLKIPELLKKVKEAAGLLHMDMGMLKRPLNVGFSGGEKKRAEILQMKLLEPKLCVLDETDFGSGYRCAEDCRRWRQCPALSRSRHRRDHALPAPARIYRAGQCACALQGPGYQVRRQIAGRRT